MKKTKYHADWQVNRINFIKNLYPTDFFKGKRILELGSFNGFIGASFNELGAEVHCIEGRSENVKNILRDYPQLTAEVGNLDISDWNWGKWDIIINFGLIYHLEFYHKEHLKNCIENCDLMFLESVIYNSPDSEIYFRDEANIPTIGDQSLSELGGTPSTSYVEDILTECNTKFVKYTDSALNGNGHHYDWDDTLEKSYHDRARRFWIVDCNV
jgi:hypothetical protein